MNHLYKIMIVFLISGLFIPVLYAADDVRSVYPDAVQKRAEETLEYYQQTEKLKEKKETEDVILEPETPPEIKRDEQGAVEVYVEQIIAGPSEILPEEDIRALTKGYEKKKATINELNELVAKINELYRSRFFIGARAFLTPQTIQEGVVKITLIEGRVGEVIIKDNQSTRASFIKKRIYLKPGDFVNIKDLEADLTFFNAVYDIKLRVELRAGKKRGTTDAIFIVQEPQKLELTCFSDNAGREDIGLYRMGTLLAVNSPLGIRDRLALGTYWAEGTYSGSVSYDWPVNRYGTRVGFSYDYNQTRVIDGPFEVLDIDGDSFDGGFHVTHPLTGQADKVVNSFMGLDFKESTTEFSGIPLYDTKVSTVSFGFDGRLLDQEGMWYTRHALTVGMDALGGETDFVRYNGDISRFHILKDDWVVILRGSGQYANEDLLPSSEQFQIGGLSTVRGFSEGLLIGDKGYILSAELNFPLFKQTHQWRDKLKGSFFIDHGGAFPKKPEGESIDNNDFLSSTGVGLIFNFSRYFSGRINYGFPLSDQERSEGEGKFHFYIQSNIW